MVLPFYGNIEISGRKSENPGDVVTELDMKVEHFLSRELGRLDPGIGFVGEETGGNRDTRRFWLNDPIDGTGHLERGMPFCTTMLALIEDAEVTFSIIYDFVHDNMYVARRGLGATHNGKPIHVSARSLKNAYIGCETHSEKPENSRILGALQKTSAIFKTICSGYEYAMVASGKLDARVCFDPFGKDYDFAPGSLLVREAGGVVANIGASAYDYRNVNHIAANPIIYQQLTEGADALFPN